MKIPVDSQDKRERQRQRQRNRGKLPFVGSRTGDCSMSPLTSFHRIAHDTFSSFLLSLVHSLSLSNSMTNVASCLLSTMAFDLFSFILVLVSSIKHFSLERTDLSYWVQKMSLIPGSASGGSKREL